MFQITDEHLPFPLKMSQPCLTLLCFLSDMLLDDTCGEGGSRKEGRHVKMVVSLDEQVRKRLVVGLVLYLKDLYASKTKHAFVSQEGPLRHFLIGCIGVSGKTKWDVLDGVVRRLFKVNIRNNTGIKAISNQSRQCLKHF